MGLTCMESLGRRYTEALKQKDVVADETYVLFEQVFADYLMEADEKSEIEVLKEHKKYFDALKEEYSYGCSIPYEEQNDDAKRADALMFYISTGLVKAKDDKYFLDSKKLKDLFVQYEDYKMNIKGESYQKGPRI